MSAAPLRLLALLAHPDDESLGMGGTLARYAAEGVETHVVTATLGDRGRYHGQKDGPDHPGPEKLARIREGELRAAAGVLGLKSLAILGYGDGRLDQAEPREIVTRLAGEIRRVRPQVVITFGPEGAYGHPDHIAISQFAAAATLAALDPAHAAPGEPHAVAKFYYMVFTDAKMKAYQEAFKKLVSLVDGVERESNPWPDWEVTTWLDTAAHWETVWRAIQCHDSQTAAYEKLAKLSPEGHAALWGTETYYRVFSRVNGGRAVERDLFEGLRG